MKYVDDRMREGIEEYSMLRDQRENPVPFMDSIQRMVSYCFLRKILSIIFHVKTCSFIFVVFVPRH